MTTPAEASPDDFLSAEQAVRPDLPDLQAIARERLTAEWGVRQTDGALVIHLFPPIVKGAVAGAWNTPMDKCLDAAIPQMFEKSSVNAGFEEEYNSFYIIVRGVISPDPRLLVQRFLEKIEAAMPH